MRGKAKGRRRMCVWGRGHGHEGAGSRVGERKHVGVVLQGGWRTLCVGGRGVEHARQACTPGLRQRRVHRRGGVRVGLGRVQGGGSVRGGKGVQRLRLRWGLRQRDGLLGAWLLLLQLLRRLGGAPRGVPVCGGGSSACGRSRELGLRVEVHSVHSWGLQGQGRGGPTGVPAAGRSSALQHVARFAAAAAAGRPNLRTPARALTAARCATVCHGGR